MTNKEFLTETKEYRKKPVTVTAYQTDKEIDIETLEGTMHADIGDFIVTGVQGEQYPVKQDIFHATYDLDDDNSIDAFVIDNCIEWGNLITELKYKEPKLYELKEAYQALSDEIIEATDFKALYGKNNAEVRKNHVKNELADQHKEIKDLEFRIDHIARRLSYLKSLVSVKTALLNAKNEDEL